MSSLLYVVINIRPLDHPDGWLAFWHGTHTHTHTQAKAISSAAVEILEYNTFSFIISSTLLVDFYSVGYDYEYCCNCLATIIHMIMCCLSKLFMKVIKNNKKAKKSHWTEFYRREVLESKDM